MNRVQGLHLYRDCATKESDTNVLRRANALYTYTNWMAFMVSQHPPICDFSVSATKVLFKK